MNFGTPQEMVDDYRENNPNDDGSGDFVLFIIYIIFVICVIKFIK